MSSLKTRLHDLAEKAGIDLRALSTRIDALAPLIGVAGVNGRSGTIVLDKNDVGLGNADNTADSTKAVLSATKLTTARNINGVAFDGSANITLNAVDATARVPAIRLVSTTAPLTGGGDLSADRTLAISAATGAAAGSMSAADKTKLDAITGTNTGDQTTITGNAGTATALQNSRNFSISGAGITAAAVGFNGTAAVALAASVDAGHITLARMADMATASVIYRKTAGAGPPEVNSLATLKTDLGLTGTNSGDQTSIVGITGTVAQFNTAITDADITIAARNINTTAPITGGGDLTADRTIAISAATTGAAGSMSAQDKTRLDAHASFYRCLIDSSGSITAAAAAGTYGMPQGEVLAITGTGTAYPLNALYIAAADYPVIGTLNPKLRIRVMLYCNDVAPGVTFTIGLHPITRPATSGGAGVCIYTIGAAVASSTVAIATPAADSSNVAVTAADIALPADGHYIIGVVTSGGALAASSHVHISAVLQLRYA